MNTTLATVRPLNTLNTALPPTLLQKQQYETSRSLLTVANSVNSIAKRQALTKAEEQQSYIATAARQQPKQQTAMLS
jgi:hypothetical protein